MAVPAVGDGSNGQLIVNFNVYGFSTLFSSVNLCILHFLPYTSTKDSKPTKDSYEYAMVGTPELDGLWLMSRTPLPIPPAIRAQFIEKATANGFNVTHLHAVEHRP